jgi:hypothetical protein
MDLGIANIKYDSWSEMSLQGDQIYQIYPALVRGGSTGKLIGGSKMSPDETQGSSCIKHV